MDLWAQVRSAGAVVAVTFVCCGPEEIESLYSCVLRCPPTARELHNLRLYLFSLKQWSIKSSPSLQIQIEAGLWNFGLAEWEVFVLQRMPEVPAVRSARCGADTRFFWVGNGKGNDLFL